MSRFYLVAGVLIAIAAATCLSYACTTHHSRPPPPANVTVK